MTRKTKDRILLGVNIFLVLALSVAVFGFFRKNNDLSNARDEIAHKQTAIQQQTEINKELEEKLKEAEKIKASIEAELDTANKEKEKLQGENSMLQKDISELKAKRETAAQNLVKLTAVSQNPMPEGKVCYLTFDDGPTENTLRILEILKKYDIKATFFVIDTPHTNIEYIKQVHADGHTVGLHSSSHNYGQIYSSTDAYFKDLNTIAEKVYSIIGVSPKVIRFPGGGSNKVSKQYCRGIMTYLTSTEGVAKYGHTYFDWNVDSSDASETVASTSKIVNSVLQGAKNKNSICVLMHDAKSKTTTVDALPQIIEGLKAQGFTFAPLTKDCHGFHHNVKN